tara:strand:- start:16406 stop:16714 length:309 start_codon:yes stop_codon:yes gene_type:complete
MWWDELLSVVAVVLLAQSFRWIWVILGVYFIYMHIKVLGPKRSMRASIDYAFLFAFFALFFLSWRRLYRVQFGKVKKKNFGKTALAIVGASAGTFVVAKQFW